MILLLILHLLIRPAYAQEATPSATIAITPAVTVTPLPITETPTLLPTITPTPSLVFSNPSATQSATSEATISITNTPAPTTVPVSPTPLLVAQIASPTPTQPVQAKAIAFVKKINDLFAQPITFPKSFFSNSKQGNFYLSSSLSPQTTNRLLGISGLLFLAGLGVLFGKEIVLFTVGKMKSIWSSGYFFRERQLVLDEEQAEYLASDIN